MFECTLFAGPSLTEPARAAAFANGIRLLPPVVRDDVARLVDRENPSTLVIADGRFHEAVSVGHAELRLALQSGWRVWGLASIGAIRAYEMREFGMRGYGAVYDLFSRFDDFQDDEVALLHRADPPYDAGSEPLVHLRVALHALVRAGFLESSAAAKVTRALKRLWYGDRTLPLFEDLINRHSTRRNRSRVRTMLQPFDRFRIKQKDLAAFLASRSLS